MQVQFLGACTKQTPYMLVTELMTGGSLQDAFRLMNFQMPLRRGLEIALDAARGMVRCGPHAVPRMRLLHLIRSVVCECGLLSESDHV
jgi:hypothetical protein